MCVDMCAVVCMYVCLYVCMCVCVCVCVFVCVYACMHVCVCMYVYVYVYMQAHTTCVYLYELVERATTLLALSAALAECHGGQQGVRVRFRMPGWFDRCKVDDVLGSPASLTFCCLAPQYFGG